MSSLASMPAKVLPDLKRRAGTTPGRLWVCMIVTALAAAMFGVSVLQAVQEARTGAQQIGRESAPSVVAAQRIRFLLADSQEQAVTEALVNGSDNGVSYARFQQNVRLTEDALVVASSNISHAGEQEELQRIAQGLAQYVGLVETARANNRQGYPVGAAYLRLATKQMRDQLLTAAQNLTNLNNAQLDAAYARHQRSNMLHLAAVAVSFTLLLGTITYTQFAVVRKRFRRRFNRSLLTASALLIGFCAYTMVAVVVSSSQLSTARQDAFQSVQTLWQARALAYDMNADASLYLLKRGGDAEYDRTFTEKSKQLVLLLDQAQGSIDFAGEQEALGEATKAYMKYMVIDKQMRELEGTGNHAGAIEVNVGSGDNQSQQAFAQMDKALTRALEINQREFDSKVDSAFARIFLLDGAGIVVALIIVVLTWVGIKPRLDEFAA